MKLNIRKENPEDFEMVFNLFKEAFKDEQMSDHTEKLLVERLRKTTAFVPKLSMVAEIDDTIVSTF